MTLKENLRIEYINLKYAKKRKDRLQLQLLQLQRVAMTLLDEENFRQDNDINSEITYYNNIIREIRKYIYHVSVENRNMYTNNFEPDSIYYVF